MPSSSEAFGIYVHWPFCKAKCPYCDFNSHVRHQEVDTMSFAKALTAELRWFAGITPGRIVSSIFFGGGTPSLMPPAAVAEVIDQIAQLWPVADTVEITLEANPTSVEAENFRGYRTAGVNRVSVGVQALNENDLKALGRQHTPDEALKAFRLAAKIFPRVSFDMIYARPQQTTAQWKDELTRALGEQEGHMSLYQLTIEPGTAYFDLQAGARSSFPMRTAPRTCLNSRKASPRSMAFRPTRFRTMRARARSRGITCSTGATANMWALARARMRALPKVKTAAPSSWKNIRRPGASWSPKKAMALLKTISLLPAGPGLGISHHGASRQRRH